MHLSKGHWRGGLKLTPPDVLGLILELESSSFTEYKKSYWVGLFYFSKLGLKSAPLYPILYILII